MNQPRRHLFPQPCRQDRARLLRHREVHPAPGKRNRPALEGGACGKILRCRARVREAEGVRVLCITRWPEDKQARFYVFFYVNPDTKRITYRAVDEFVETKAKDS